MGGKPGDFPLDEGHVCADADEVNDADFHGTAELLGELEQELGHATARNIEEALDQQEVCESLLPSGLRSRRKRGDFDPEVAAMQRLKEAALEHVRWRSLSLPADPGVTAISNAMRAMVRAWAQTEYADTNEPRDLHVLWQALQVPKTDHKRFEVQVNFLEAAHQRSLGVVNLKKDEVLRKEYFMLLKALPPIVKEKVGSEQLETELGRAKAIIGLVNKHSGEIVQLKKSHPDWTLEWRDCASLPLHEQWFCRANGAPSMRPDKDFGWPPGRCYDDDLDLQIRNVLERDNSRASVQELRPDCKKQYSRITCPCVDADCGYEWVRTGTIFTLGELFLALGKQHTAHHVYSFYHTLRLVAVKRRKQHGAGKGSGRATGVTASPFQAARLRWELRSNKAQLIEELSLIHISEPTRPY